MLEKKKKTKHIVTQKRPCRKGPFITKRLIVVWSCRLCVFNGPWSLPLELIKAGRAVVDEEVPSGKRKVHLKYYCQHFIVSTQFPLSPQTLCALLNISLAFSNFQALTTACLCVCVFSNKSSSGSNVGGFVFQDP